MILTGWSEQGRGLPHASDVRQPSCSRTVPKLSASDTQNLRNVVSLGLAVERVKRADHPIHGGGVEEGLATAQTVKGLRRQANRLKFIRWLAKPDQGTVTFEELARVSLPDAVVAHRFHLQPRNDDLHNCNGAVTRGTVDVQHVKACRLQMISGDAPARASINARVCRQLPKALETFVREDSAPKGILELG
jgi:hypothetical protein